MAHNKGSSLSNARGREMYVGSQIRDSLSLLDVLYANAFEEEDIDSKVAKKTEVDFYRGAPPQWLNFCWAERATSADKTTTFIKRDGYTELIQNIKKPCKGDLTSTMNLMYQPGSGGTTLAKQVLWDMRKTLRCAVLTGPTSDITAIAKQVIHLFTAGGQGHQNTVLLLLEDERILENLQDAIIKEITDRNITTHMPVVIILNCVRKEVIKQEDHNKSRHVILRMELSEAEKKQFEEKQIEISRSYSNEHKQFHGFNIMRENFSGDYVKETCAFLDVRKKRRPKKSQLLSFLSLVNAYVPGSHLLESQCQAFLGPPDPNYGGPSFEQRMEPFSHLIVTFPSQQGQDKHVRMAHPLIAQQCVKVLATAGVTRSDTARNFLIDFCGEEVQQHLMPVIKDMLTKREITVDHQQNTGHVCVLQNKPTKREMGEERKDTFSRLIHDIEANEIKSNCVSVLQLASEKITQNPFFPQALARFFYLRMEDYGVAEQWAKIAKDRDPKNSFVADTLGQVYKKHLNSRVHDPSISAQDILQLAVKAFEAFKDVERAAENEQGADMQDDGMTKVSHIFNNRGLFGYLRVANIVFDSLVSLDNNWQKVLTMEISADSFFISINQLFKYKPLIINLRDEVERKFEFFDGYLTYSKPSMKINEPNYFQTDVKNCYCKYVGTCTPIHSESAIDVPLQKLKEEMAITFPGLLCCLDKGYDESNLSRITKLWEEIQECEKKKDGGGENKAAQNFILANIILSKVEAASPMLTPLPILRRTLERHLLANYSNQTPEFYLLVLLLFWPEEHKKIGFNIDLNKRIIEMQDSYNNTYKKHLRSRYLRPLIFLGKGEGLSRLVHRSKIDNLFVKENQMARPEARTDTISGEVWRKPSVQDLLLPVNGVVRQHRVFARVDGKEIEVCADQQSKVWKSGDVCFYLGFTIRGPVAYGIQYPSHHGHFFHSDRMTGEVPRKMLEVPDIKSIKDEPVRSCATCANVMESTNWVQVEPVVIIEEAPMFSMSPAGRYECRVSGLRWVCKDHVSLQYQFSSWEPHSAMMKSLGYKQGGPLLDVTIIAGELEEVHLPHFACFGDDPSFKEKVRVLHVEDCGVSVKQVDEVTRFHVKILHPTFSPKGVLVRSGFPLKVHCDLLLYQAKAPSWTDS
ncbi:sterile alpha motif domain-containing protein 9-like [Oncorhynchus kisutch]|uniref:Sterile alpha motif domain-containing protein 9-like n=1 Tax=Oncorhynchus kisutch TaxID=8019 RepID=A0A8C7DQG5_ONCKI|nr:sterile alpha motif domain-containing protein 9-like [Oncorhynchus kisutch]XP_031648826.1 sterile alpha motif domain-containing protein 9-like [Oncorhynchus kisutch]XP_031648827.1 sterile alpha motif domain-containing protein 9-like [Oncorhynchus kisutch]